MSKPQGIFQPLGLATILAIGFAAVFALAVGWGSTIWEGLHNRVSQYQTLMVRLDGTPLIRRATYGDYQRVTFHALDGSEVPGLDDDQPWLVGAPLTMPRQDRLMFPLGGRARIARFADGQMPPNLWYFIHDGARDGRGYFVGYDGQSKLGLGFIGRDGFRPDPPPVEQYFPVDGVKMAGGSAFSRYAGNGYWNGVYNATRRESPQFPAWKVDMISGSQLLEVDLRTGSVTTLMESAGLVAMGMLDGPLKAAAAEEKGLRFPRPEKLAARTADRVFVFEAAGKKPLTYLVPEELRDRSFVFYELDAGKVLLTARRMLPDRNSREDLYWTDASGSVLRHADVCVENGTSRFDERASAWNAALIIPAPAVLAFLATVVMPFDIVLQGLEADHSAALARCLAAWWPPLLLVSLLAAALAWHCCRRHRRYCQPASAAWFVFVLLAGVPGLVAYLYHRRWPVLEKCPTCERDVPRDREACARCGAAFPPPEPKGCEVFA